MRRRSIFSTAIEKSKSINTSLCFRVTIAASLVVMAVRDLDNIITADAAHVITDSGLLTCIETH